jgi:hypothetical protein
MIKAISVATITFTLWGMAFGQALSAPHTYALSAVIEHHAGSATVKANSAIPMEQAVAAVNEEYGWVVDYEDPPYAGTDVTLRPRSSAGGPPDTVVAGGAFQSTYPETPNMWSSRATEMEVLQKIVADYNASGNPGRFTVMELPDGNFDVVGVATHSSSGAEVPITPTLNTRISIPVAPRTITATLHAILEAALHTKVFIGGPGGLGGIGSGSGVGEGITVGGSNVPARDLVMQVIQKFGGKWAWGLVDSDPQPKQPVYTFGVGPAMRAEYDTLGRRWLNRLAPGQ